MVSLCLDGSFNEALRCNGSVDSLLCVTYGLPGCSNSEFEFLAGDRIADAGV